MSHDVYIKCQNCGTLNLNRDYCEKCGAIINITLKRALQREQDKKKKEEKKQQEEKKPNKAELFFQKFRNHPNAVIRAMANGLYSLWWLVMIIGGIFAYIATIIAA